MVLIATFLFSSFLQMLFLLGTSHALGPAEYASYSLIMVGSVFATTIIFEPVRMILVRYGGMRRIRVRQAIITTIRKWVELAVFAVVPTALLIALACLLCGYPPASIDVAAFGLAIASNGFNDSVATYLRFVAEESSYIRFTLARALLSGGCMLIAATLLHSGAIALIAYSAANLIVAYVFREGNWPQHALRIKHRLTLSFWTYGASLALNSIGVNFAFAVSRAGLKLCLSQELVGAIFLGLDLATRGISVLGQAINTWSARPVFDAMHTLGVNGATKSFQRTSTFFLGAWGTFSVYGAALSFLIPLYVLHVSATPRYRLVLALNIVALLTVFLKLYCLDVLLSAVDRPREIAYSAIVVAGMTALVVALSYFSPTMIAAFSFPIATAIAILAYAVRNWNLFEMSLEKRDVIYVSYKMLWLTATFLWVPPSPVGVIFALLLGFVVDLIWLYKIWSSGPSILLRETKI